MANKTLARSVRALVAVATVAAAATAVGALAGPARAATGVNYVFSPNPIAATGSLAQDTSVIVTLTVEDSSGAAVPGGSAYLSFSSTASPSGSACVQTASGCTSLTGTAAQFTAASNGQLHIDYTTANPNGFQSYPTTGEDDLFAQDTASNPNVKVQDFYKYSNAATVDTYEWSPNPIAFPGSLAPNATVTVNVQPIKTATGKPEGGASFDVSFNPTSGGGSLSTSSTSCTPTGTLNSWTCRTDSAGDQIPFTYTAPSPLPPGGQDVITATNTSGAEASSDTYQFKAAQLGFNPVPIAPTGSLGSSQTQSILVTATDTSGQPVANAQVFLSLTGSGSGGAAAGTASATNCIATGSQQVTGCTGTIGSSPSPFKTDNNGQVAITYSTPSSPPSSGTDTITAQDNSPNPTNTVTDTYTYAPATYVFSPNPIADPGSLSGSQSVKVTLTVQANGSPQSGGSAYLSFSQATGGGSASVGQTKLTSTPTQFTADSGGHIEITYTAPSSPPKSGTDTITAQDASSKPTKSASDAYEFSHPAGPAEGYWLVGSDGGIFSFGNAGFYGSTGNIHLAKPVVGMTATPDGKGYWFVASDGGIFSYGDANFFGSLGATHLNAPVVGMASTPDGKGYWLVASDGGIFSFGDAKFYGSTGNLKLAAPIVGMAANPDGGGYWFVGQDGGIFSFGDSKFHGSEGATHLAAPIVGMASTATGNGYWMVGADGGIFSFGDAAFYGSTGNIRLAKPVVGMTVTPDGAGYWFVASDGGVFSFGDAQFSGSEGGKQLAAPIVGMAAT
ncbi:MAG TPA: hypothetical protein VE990_18285 [Acidimicrobiales bacterium]|nr:hypothetical protein [Acidimicrobiales bacterium]